MVRTHTAPTARRPQDSSLLRPHSCDTVAQWPTSTKSLRPPTPTNLPQRSPSLKFEGRKRQHDADAFMADIVAKRLVRYLERARYVVMKRPAWRAWAGL